MKVKFISKEWEEMTHCKAGKIYDVISIGRGWYEGSYRIKTENGEDALVNPELFEIIDDSNPALIHDPLTINSDRSLMTSWYKEFLKKIHIFIDKPTTESAIDFVRFIDGFWFYHENDLYIVDDNISSNCEYANVFMIRILCESFDDYDRDTDPYDHYCRESNKLYQNIIEKIDYIESPEYE